MGSDGRRDFYKILEIESNADQETIKKAYRRLALLYHPDRNRGSEREAEVKFREIHEAYAVLSDPQKRRDYDSGVDDTNTRPSYRNPADVFNMFNTFFGRDFQYFSGPGGARGFYNHNGFGYAPTTNPAPFTNLSNGFFSSTSYGSTPYSYTVSYGWFQYRWA